MAETTTTAELIPLLDAYGEYLGAVYGRPALRFALGVHGTASQMFPRRPRPTGRCDVLLLSPSESWARRVWRLEQSLREHGLTVVHVVRPSEPALLRLHRYCVVPREIPPRWRFLAGYAEYLLRTLQPAVVVQATDADPLSVFLKLSAEKRGVRTVNIAHAVLVPHPLKSMFCFDYYFVFGPSSIDGAIASPLRFGETKLVQTGYVLIESDFALPPAPETKTLLFFSTWLYGGSQPFARAYNAAAREGMHVLATWLRTDPGFEVLVRCHPDENPALVQSIVGHLPGVRILPPGRSIKADLARAGMALGMVTNAAIEAALLRRPFRVVFGDGVLPNHLELESYFGPRASTPEQLGDAVREVQSDFDGWLKRCDAFASRHLAYTTDSLDVTVTRIADIARGTEGFPVTHIPTSLAVLRT